MKTDIINYIIAWLWTILQLIVLVIAIRVMDGRWGSIENLAFCLGLIALFDTVRIRQKL